MSPKPQLVIEKIALAPAVGGMDDAAHSKPSVLVGFESPRVGQKCEAESFWMRGWILAPGTTLEELRLMDGDKQLGTFVPGAPREDVVRAAGLERLVG